MGKRGIGVIGKIGEKRGKGEQGKIEKRGNRRMAWHVAVNEAIISGYNMSAISSPGSPAER